MAKEAILREVKLSLPMAPDMEVTASTTAATLADSMGMSADKIDEVRMAVVEACINALEHSRAANKMVFVTVAVLGDKEPRRLRIVVEDHGVGFAVGKVEEPDLPRKLKENERKRGWGLKIMRGLMDDVEVVSGDRGTSIVLSKLL